MHTLRFWFDPVSPFAWLAFQQLPLALSGISHRVVYTPVFLGPLLRAHGQLGPAEVPPKRAWTYRHVQWLAHQLAEPLEMPLRHPFNPVALLRLALAAAVPGAPDACNRDVAETVFRHVWTGGADATDPQRLAQLRDTLAAHQHARGRTLADPESDAIKAQLRTNTEAALAAGVFGVPSVQVGERVFWGLDSLPMLAACLRGDPWFEGPGWHDDAADRPSGLAPAAATGAKPLA